MLVRQVQPRPPPRPNEGVAKSAQLHIPRQSIGIHGRFVLLKDVQLSATNRVVKVIPEFGDTFWDTEGAEGAPNWRIYVGHLPGTQTNVLSVSI